MGQNKYSTEGIYSWICPAGVTSVTVECWGGGGAGQGMISGNIYYGNGGGGGAYSRKANIPVTPGNSYSVKVGERGLASGVSDGGESYFISTGTIWAEGGKGGYQNGTPGTLGSGDVLYSGGWGAVGDPSYGGGGGGSSAGTNSIGGDASTYIYGYAPAGGGDGGQGYPAYSGSNTYGNGYTAKSPGGGGGGAAKDNRPNAVYGGNGGYGQVIISWIDPPSIFKPRIIII